MTAKTAEPDNIEIVGHPLPALGARELRQVQQGVLDVLLGGQHRQQVEILEDESDGTGAQISQLVGCSARDIIAFDVYPALAGIVDTAHDVQEGGFAAARRACDGEKSTRFNGQADIPQRVHQLFPEQVALAHFFYLYNCHA